MAELRMGPLGRWARRPALAGSAAMLGAAWLLLAHDPPARAVAAGEVAAEEVVPEPRAAHAPRADLPPAVRAYLAFAADPLAPAAANASHDYIARGLGLLADALAADARRGAAPDTAALARVALLRGRVDALREDRRWSEHTRYAREACFAAGDALSALDGGERAVTAVWDAAGRLEADRGLIEQTDRVQRFFVAAATALGER